MRLWHKDLISVLPRQQLIGQWRECCLIAKNIQEQGTPNHILVNKIMDYPIDHFVTYTYMVYNEMCGRGYFPRWDNFGKYDFVYKKDMVIDSDLLFPKWHDKSYLEECYYNLKEKHECGGITDDEWTIILRRYVTFVSDYRKNHKYKRGV